MKKNTMFVALFSIFLLFSSAWARVNDYTFTQTSGSFSSISGTLLIASGQDNAVSPTTNIGFTFRFNDTNFTEFSASSNGFIRLGAQPSTTAYTLISTPVTNCICAAAMNGRTNGTVVFGTSGSTPNRIAIIQYNNYRLQNSGNNNQNRQTFQIRLYETSNVVEIVYGSSSGTKNVTANVQVGLRGSTAANDFSNRTGNNWANTTAGITSGATKNWSTTYYPASGQTYRWTPPSVFEISPNSITRLLAVNTIKQDKVTLSNNSSSSVTINSISSSPSWLTHDLTTPATIAANGSREINFTLNATGMAAGTHTANLTIQSSSGTILLSVSMRVITSTVPESPRHIAQWEPARGAIITYTTGTNYLGIPNNMIKDFYDYNEELFVVVSSGNLNTARNYFNNTIGIDPDDVTWIIATSNTYWIRDYGPMSIYHGTQSSRELGIVDFGYNRTNRTSDNAVNTAICNQLGIPRFPVELSMSGGNVLTNGRCQEFADEWVFLQNDTDPATGNGTGDSADPYDYRYTLTEFLDLVQIFRGELRENGFHTWPDPLNEYIHHIDCWAKLLSPTTILIADGMGGTTETALDAIATEVATFLTCYDEPYNVVRVNCPNNAPYANSYILNDRVYIPFMGTNSRPNAADNAALAVYQAAMPGYTVQGYFRRNASTPWLPTDAVHCRVNTIYKTEDDSTVPVELSSFTASISVDSFVNLSWVTQSETGVLGFYVIRNTESDLSSATTVSNLIPATNTSQLQRYVYKDTDLYDDGLYYYWLQNTDLDGSVDFHGPISIQFGTSGGNAPEIPLVTQLDAIYPNPFNPRAYIPFSLKSHSTVSIEIYNVRGQLVKSLPVGQKAPGHHRIEWDGRDDLGRSCGTGIYHIRMTADNESFLRKAILMK